MPSRKARLRRRIEARGGFQPRVIAIIAIVWCLLWDRLSWGNALNGLIIGLFATFVFPLPSIQYSGRIHPIGLLNLLAHFAFDLVKASVEVARFALQPGPPPRGSIVEVHLRTRSDLYLTLTAVLISLVPGSIVIDARRAAGVLFVHDIFASNESEIDECRHRVLAEEARVVRALGSKDEIAQLDKSPEVVR